MNWLIQNGSVWLGGALHTADVRLAGGRVAEVGPGLASQGAEVLNAEGCALLPAFTDLHVHLREPGFEAKETVQSGTLAAAAGGFTTVCSMPNLAPVPDGPEALAPQLAAIARDAVVRVLPYGAISLGERGEAPAAYDAMAASVAGFSDDGVGVRNEALMRGALTAAARCGLFVAAHCEDAALLPADGITVQAGSPLAKAQGWAGTGNESEWREVERDARLAAETGGRLHVCHTSAAESFALVRRAKAAGAPVSCEVTPHNLLLCCEDVQDEGRFRMNPPLRRPEDRDAALAAVLDGTADAIATDHAPHTAAEKDGPFAASLNGVVGLETAFPVLYTKLVLPGRLPLARLLALLNDGPRRILGEEPAAIAPGAAAELTVVALEEYRKVEPAAFCSKGRATPFAGWQLCGWPRATFHKGKLVYRRGKE